MSRSKKRTRGPGSRPNHGTAGRMLQREGETVSLESDGEESRNDCGNTISDSLRQCELCQVQWVCSQFRLSARTPQSERGTFLAAFTLNYKVFSRNSKSDTDFVKALGLKFLSSGRLKPDPA